MEVITMGLREEDIKKEEAVTLVSPTNPNPTQRIYLSNIDQTVAFPVETIFFFESMNSLSTDDVIERVRRALSEELLIPYYFMAGRLGFNEESKRLELVCNNGGVLFAGATSRLRLSDLGDVSLPNPSFHHLILRIDGSKSLNDTPLFTVQVTKFSCGGYSIGFVTNHSAMDGRAAAEMFQTLATICKSPKQLALQTLNLDRYSYIKPRSPPLITFHHDSEYTISSSPSSSFTNPSLHLSLSPTHTCKLFSFTTSMINSLKLKAMTPCSSFEAMVAHLWRTRTKAVFDNPLATSSVLFAVDIRTKLLNPPLPPNFIGNAVITAAATAKVMDMEGRPFSFCVDKVKAAIEMVNDEYVRSVIDWLEVHRGGVPSAVDGNFYVSAWWKLPFHELDFGHGMPVYGGPVVSGMDEFVLLLKRKEGGVNVWMSLEKMKMEKFFSFVFDF